MRRLKHHKVRRVRAAVGGRPGGGLQQQPHLCGGHPPGGVEVLAEDGAAGRKDGRKEGKKEGEELLRMAGVGLCLERGGRQEGC